MSDSGDPGQESYLIERLRQLYDGADDEDRPRAAMFLGLALADRMDALLADDARRGNLAKEGLERLAESAITTPAVAAAIERLHRCRRPSTAPEPDPGPASFPLGGGDLNWDLDWGVLRGPSEASRKLVAMLPFLASMLPPEQASMRNALTTIKEVLDRFEQGHWSPEGDAALSAAIELVETGGLGAGVAVILRVAAMTIRMQRCQLTLAEGGLPDWPSLAELDRLIDQLDSADDLSVGFGAPFEAVEGVQHLYFAIAIMMRLQVSVRAPGVRRDAALLSDILRLLDRANDHLGQMPAAHKGLFQPVRAKLAEMAAALRDKFPEVAVTYREASRTAAPRGPSPAPAPAPQSAPAPTPSSAKPSPAPAQSSAPSATPSSSVGDIAAWLSNPAMSQLSPQVLDGLQILIGQAEGPVALVLTSLLLAMDTVNSRTWDPAYDDRLAELEAEAGRRSEEDQPSDSRALMAAALAIAHSARCLQRSASPRVAEHPVADDFWTVLAETESALDLAARVPGGPASGILETLSAMQHGQAAFILVELARLDVPHRTELLGRTRGHFGQIPAGMRDRMPVLGDMSLLAQLMEGSLAPDDPAVDAIIDRNPNVWDREGLDLRRALVWAARAGKSQEPQDVGTALLELQTVWIMLPAGSPMRAQLLIAMATMQNLLMIRTGHQQGADAASLSIAAVRTATNPGELRGAAHLLVTTFLLMVSRKDHSGPFPEAADALNTALTRVRPDDWVVRTTLLTAVAAAAALSAATGPEASRAAAREALADAERALPDPLPTDDWYATAQLLGNWVVAQALGLGDAKTVPLASELVDTLEAFLSTHPGFDTAATELERLREVRRQITAAAGPPVRTGGPGDQTPGDGHQPDPTAETLRQVRSQRLSAAAVRDVDALRACATDLHAALATAAADTQLRHQLDQMLGLVHADLFAYGPDEEADEYLREAVIHLNRALVSEDHDLPTVERADTLDVLARCLREVSQRHAAQPTPATAERVARAALRELADCVLVAGDRLQAVGVAARANDIVARAVGWCLADGRYRAAVDIAETGRGLVLAAVVLSGRIEEVLRGAGQPEAADAWSAGNGSGRAAALNALRETMGGSMLLSTPIGEEISVTLAATPFDAVVYLVPSAGPDSAGLTGQAILVRPANGEIEVVELPELSGPERATPLDAYLAALDRALAEFDPDVDNEDGFRGGRAGQAWTGALDEVGRWTYACIVEPLLRQISKWSLGHLPHLALVPLGQLAAIPYAAAWTDGPADGGRRYAIDDVILSYAASARLLGETARRPRRPLSERVVLVCNPDGDLPMTRRATRLLARRQYPDAKFYGTTADPNGSATIEVLLDALPAGNRAGASLLQLSTHGHAEPEPALQAAGHNWLPLASILDQAQGRAPEAPGGLVITNACLTDVTRTHYDESLTLATAFLAGGATAVIGTRWPVDDDTVAVLSLRLHYHLQLGRSPAEALRLAQLDLLRPTQVMRDTLDPQLADLSDARLSHAAAWAGHVHHGV